MRSFNTDPRGPYIKMNSGRLFYLNDPRADEVHLDDIARNLAGINRYTGGSRYTVAQHCVAAAEMARYFYPDEKYLPAKMLIHDADEAYFGDVSSPLKSLLPDYRLLEDKAQLAIEEKFELLFIEDPLVKEVDFRMWLTEREILFAGRHGSNDYYGPLKPFEGVVEGKGLSKVHHSYFVPWSADEAETMYLMSIRKAFPWLQ